MKKITLQKVLEIHQKNAIRYSKNISHSCQARINLLSLALENNTQPDDEGWVFIGDIQKEFRRLRGEPCKKENFIGLISS